MDFCGSDHFPVWGLCKAKFKLPISKDQKKMMPRSAKKEEIIEFNEHIRNNRGGENVFAETLREAAENCIEKQEKKPKKPWITDDTLKLIDEKHALENRGKHEEYKKASKVAAKAVREDWKKWLAEITDHELDIRDKWLGIKYIKRNYSPKLYEKACHDNKNLPFEKHADAAADYLEKKQWAPIPEGEKTQRSNVTNRKESLRKDNRPYKNDWNCGDFDFDELSFIVKKLKRGKAAGPDEIPMEFYKWLDEENLCYVLDIINGWWREGTFPNEDLKALTASIYKKGDPKKQENYRPISLLNSAYKLYAALLQTRIAFTIDRHLQRTQYGFRKSRSTVIPLGCVRRIIERAEAAEEELHVVFLDWEKAFDKIDHDQLLWSLDMLGFPAPYMNAIKSLYTTPQFAVKIDNKTSSWRTQNRGIRQGCPLSPYLFLCVMHVLFEIVHDEVNLKRGTVEGLDYNELVYADDTALLTNNANAMSRFLVAIEKHAKVFGLNFNKTKCVCMSFHTPYRPKFADGSKIPEDEEIKYLGGVINRNHNQKGEVAAKIGQCFAILNKLNFFWRKSSCPDKFKLNVFDAVLRSKMVYGLDTVELPPSLIEKLNVFQLKGLRKILKMDTTFINRANTNKKVFQKANDIKNPKKTPGKNIKTFRNYIEDKQEALLKHLVRADPKDPLRQATFEPESILPVIYTKRRVGRPRKQWTMETYRRLYFKNKRGTPQVWKMNPFNAIHSMTSDIKNRTI